MAVATASTLARRDFVKLLECLCEDFPKSLQQRTLDALGHHTQQPTPPHSQQPPRAADIVAFAEFRRGVEVCLLLEELIDAVEDLFRAIDKSDAGEVRASELLLALETAASTRQQQQHASCVVLDDATLLAALKAFVLPPPPPGLDAADRSSCGDDGSELFNDRAMRLTDVYDSVFRLVFES